MFPVNFFRSSRSTTIKYLAINISPWDTTISCSRVLPFSTLSRHFTNPLVHVITVSPKIWRPKAKIEYTRIIYYDIDDDLDVLKAYGKSTTWPPQWKLRPHTDLILWDSISFTAELMKYLKKDCSIDTAIHQSILGVIKDNYDSFSEQGVSRPMFDFEFYLDIDESPRVCCSQPMYGIHERRIMNTRMKMLEDNDCICDCAGPWGSLLLLATKHYQEKCKDIKDFSCHLCVSYRPLNSVTRSFEFLIPCYTDSIENFGDSNDPIYFISLDTRPGYHQ